MADPTPTPGAVPGGTDGPPPTPPWHQGIEADVVGTWQNKGYDLADPKKIAVEVTKAYREAQGKLGVPPDQLVKLLKPDSQPTEIKEFWNRLGAPKDPKEYDFASIKYASGADLDAPLVDTLRAAFDSVHVPKDAAQAITKAFVKFQDSAAAENTAAVQAKLATERAALEKDWGGPHGSDKFERNLFVARQGAKALGISVETVNLLDKVAGYAATMQALHKVGMLNREEPRYIAGGGAYDGAMTQQQAQARINDLVRDQSWSQRYFAGGVAEKAELTNLQRIVANDFESEVA